jgi:hypothetical protein
MSTNPTPAPVRHTLRDLPLPAKLVVTTFLISVGLGYLWAMAQIHFKHASPGHPMPSLADLVARFSGVPWPLEPKPAEEPAKKADAVAEKAADATGNVVPAVKIKTIVDNRCVVCHKPGGDKDDAPLQNYDEIAKYLTKTTDHPKGHLYAVMTGPRKSWGKKSMVKAFFEKSPDWEDLTAEQRTAEEPRRELEHRLMVAWADAGAPKLSYDKDAFPLPADVKVTDLPQELRTTAAAPSQATAQPAKPPVDKWAEAKSKRLSVDALTQSTHAHLLTFSLLWAATGLIFAFTSYPAAVRTVLSPLVLIAQVADVACWWLARLDGVGPYFALAIMGTGAVVGLGLVAQIVLSVWNMYGPKGKAVVLLAFLVGAGLFGLTYVKVIAPQLQAERALAADAAE